MYNKANLLLTIMGTFADKETKFGKKVAHNILKKVGDQYDLVVHRSDKIQLDSKDVIVLRDACGGGSNMMYRFSSALTALRHYMKVPIILRWML